MATLSTVQFNTSTLTEYPAGLTSSYAITSSYALNSSAGATYTSSLYGTASWAISATSCSVYNNQGSATGYLPITANNNGAQPFWVDGVITYKSSPTSILISGGTISASSFVGSLTGLASSASNVGVSTTGNNNAYYILFATGSTGYQAPIEDLNLTYNPATNTLTAKISGTASYATVAGTVGIGSTGGASTFYIPFSANYNGSAQTLYADNDGTDLTYNPSTHLLTVSNITAGGTFQAATIGFSGDAVNYFINDYAIEGAARIRIKAYSGVTLASNAGDRLTVNKAGNVGIGTTQPTNSLDVVGNISCSIITASLFYGTASWAQSSSVAISASYAPGSSAATYTSSLYGTASWAISSSWAATCSVYLTTTNQVTQSIYATQSLFATQSLYATNSLSKSVSSTSNNTNYYFDLSTGSSGYQPTFVGTLLSYNPSTNQISGSNVGITASLYGSASYALSSSYALSASYTLSSSYAITASYTFTASYAISSAFATSASYAITSSYALNSSAGATYTSSLYGTASWATNYVSESTAYLNSYTTIYTSSLNWITCSFSYAKQYISLTQSASYQFTASNLPAGGNDAEISLYISNSASQTSSLSFPSTWVWMGILPTYLTASKNAYLQLEAFGTSIVASWGQQY